MWLKYLIWKVKYQVLGPYSTQRITYRVWEKNRYMQKYYKKMLWHKKPCQVLVEPTYKKGTIRNCLIGLNDRDRLVVPRRALRKVINEEN